MGGGSGGSGSGGRSGGGSSEAGTNGDAGQPGEVVRQANKPRSYEELTAPIKASSGQIENAMQQAYEGKDVKIRYNNISEPVISVTGKKGRGEDMTIWTRSKTIISGGKKFEYNTAGLLSAMKRFETANEI